MQTVNNAAGGGFWLLTGCHEQVWESADHPQRVWELLLGAYQRTANMRLLTGILKALRPLAASILHLPGAPKFSHILIVPAWSYHSAFSRALHVIDVHRSPSDLLGTALSLCSFTEGERQAVLQHMLAFLLHDVAQTAAGGSSGTLILIAERTALHIVTDGLQSGTPVTQDIHIFGPTLIRQDKTCSDPIQWIQPKKSY